MKIPQDLHKKLRELSRVYCPFTVFVGKIFCLEKIFRDLRRRVQAVI